ncbi:MAG: TAT-variant-translocated molybdopterin oxidoreductase [Ignavibacteria bacterium]|jgi:molybdopterin-containing oxidoreductase family iron-sulfur binding subunit
MSNSTNDNKIWKSIKEYNNDEEVLKAKHDEFKKGVTDDFDPDKLSGMSRRRFLALMGASAAFAATACSDYRDKGEIIPYNKRPEGVLPGTPNFYASSIQDGNENYGVLIKTREGRPIKIDGNPEHPINKGKVTDRVHASILSLYDPSRLKNPLKNNKEIAWDVADKEIVNKLNTAVTNGKEIAIVTNTILSPFTKRVLKDFKEKYPTVNIYSYELVNDFQRVTTWEKCYGTKELPSIKWNEANVIFSLESDFLGREGNTVENSMLYAERRDIMNGKDFNRLYVAEAGMSLTGMNADYRLRVRPDSQYVFVMSLLNEIVLKRGSANIEINDAVKNKLNKFSINNFISSSNLNKEKVFGLVDDLVKNRGNAIVYAGDILPEEVHVAVNFLNEVLGNDDLYNFENSFVNKDWEVSNDFKNLIDNMNSGKVYVVIHFSSDPVFHLNSLYGYSSALSKVETKISLTETANDTSALCDYVLPINHALESWGDSQNRKNVYTLQQPVIAPIFNTRQKESILLSWVSGTKSYAEDISQKHLMETFRIEVYDKLGFSVSFKQYWYNALHDGFVKMKDDVSVKPEFDFTSFTSMKNKMPGKDYCVQLQSSYYVGDGTYANNGWLQELPHPVSKVTWDNYAAVSSTTAKELKVENEDYIEIEVENKKLKIPVMIQPGAMDKVVTIELGYGREVIGDAGKESGFNAAVLMNTKGYSPWIYNNAKVVKSSGSYKLASTQEHHALDGTFVKDFHKIRKIIQEGTVEEYNKDHHFLHKAKHDIFSIGDDVKYKGNKWAMAIDLNKCLSCGSCVTSCNVENNIPVVGKDQVAVGREMQWIRIDRYYSGTPDEPEVSTQPMLCQHCDNAPCENVCPVNATNHSPDGLNQMVYNRCVGTRYCANNCPYKVRRFNFFNFRDNFADSYYDNELTYLVNNPEVTVRSRGVMEKCTFCVQRIMEERSNAIKDNREVDGENIVTACQEACPTNAIVFGDANDVDSKVSKYRKHDLAYHVLEELNVRPNVTYLAKLRNVQSEDNA